ncbi:hypothetical protein GEMRC1_005172 [Eukaryota sp. GEM-RC1]
MEKIPPHWFLWTFQAADRAKSDLEYFVVNFMEVVPFEFLHSYQGFSPSPLAFKLLSPSVTADYSSFLAKSLVDSWRNFDWDVDVFHECVNGFDLKVTDPVAIFEIFSQIREDGRLCQFFQKYFADNALMVLKYQQDQIADLSSRKNQKNVKQKKSAQSRLSTLTNALRNNHSLLLYEKVYTRLCKTINPTDITVCGLSQVKSLDLRDIDVSDVTFLSFCICLEELNLSGTQVVDLSPLSVLANLRILDISNTPVRDISPLYKLGSVFRHLRVSTTTISRKQRDQIQLENPALDLNKYHFAPFS